MMMKELLPNRILHKPNTHTHSPADSPNLTPLLTTQTHSTHPCRRRKTYPTICNLMNHLKHGCSGRNNTSLSLSHYISINICISLSPSLIIFRDIPMKIHRKSENLSYLPSSVHSFSRSPFLSLLSLSLIHSFLLSFSFLVVFCNLTISSGSSPLDP